MRCNNKAVIDFCNKFTEITRTKFQPQTANECTIIILLLTGQPVAGRPQRLLGKKLSCKRRNGLPVRTRNYSFIKQSYSFSWKTCGDFRKLNTIKLVQINIHASSLNLPRELTEKQSFQNQTSLGHAEIPLNPDDYMIVIHNDTFIQFFVTMTMYFVIWMIYFLCQNLQNVLLRCITFKSVY